MEIFLCRSGNNIFFWSTVRQDDSYASAQTVETYKEYSHSGGEYQVGEVLRNGKRNIKIVSINVFNEI